MRTFRKQHRSKKKLQLGAKKPTSGKGKEELLERLTEEKRQIDNLASEKGASNWLNVLPLTKYGVNLNKSELRA